MEILGIWKFLLTVYSTLLSTHETIEWPFKERPTIQLDCWMSTSLWNSQKMFHRRTSADDAWSDKTILNQNGRLKICHWHCSYPVGLNWRSPSYLIYFENTFPCWTKLWNLQKRITRYYSCTWRMETLHSRIYTYHCCPIWSQESHLLPHSQETDKTTSMMVLIPIGIQC